MLKIKYLLILIIAGTLINGCKKESFITDPDASLSISRDSIKFDTVFTTTGSVTRSFKIFNDNDQRLLLSSVKLMGGSTSPFNLNINGAPVDEMHNIEIASNDSIYVFVTVTIDPTADDLPFIISDSIQINYNGNTRFVQLQAYGQNANFLHAALITGNVTWTNTRPYVIIGGIQIDTTATLTIDPGTKIYLHANSPFIVDGTVILNGTKTENIVFTSDRLDEEYRDLPAGWPGIYIRNSSTDNVFTFAVIKNAYQGIVVEGESTNVNPKLIISQSIIDNAYDAGLFCIGTSVNTDNSLISNCGRNLVIEGGGNYNFTHCTIAAYSTPFMFHNKPAMSTSNSIIINGMEFTADLTAVFRNCIFWGETTTSENEIVVNKAGANIFDVTMDHCLYRSLDDPLNTNLISVLRNIDPLFDSIDVSNNYFDFRISDAEAPGLDTGTPSLFTNDLDDNPRNVGIPDLGSYEKQ
jgi:hypothetical protein